jgi:hypothetical protein
MWPLLCLIAVTLATQYAHNCLLFMPQYDVSGTPETIPELEARINGWLSVQNDSLHITSEGFIDIDADSITSNGKLMSTWTVRTGGGDYAVLVTRIRARQLCFYNTSDVIIPDGGSVIPPPYPNPISGAMLISPSLLLSLLGITSLIG